MTGGEGQTCLVVLEAWNSDEKPAVSAFGVGVRGFTTFGKIQSVKLPARAGKRLLCSSVFR